MFLPLNQYLLGADEYGPALPGNNYVVQRGDTLSSIAAKYLGNAGLWRDIWNANPQIDNPNVIEVGMVLNIPEARSPSNTSSVPATTGPRMTAVPGIPEDDSGDSGSSIFSSPMFLVGAAGVALVIVLLATRKPKVASA